MAISSEEQRQHMLTDPVGKLLFQKALPTVVIQLITTIYNTADTYFVAKIDTEASAAVGIVFSLMSIIQAVGYGIGMGSASIISRSLGAERDRDASETASSALLEGLVAGVIIMGAGLVFLSSFMRLLGASDKVLPYANDYATYILIAAPFMCLAFIFNQILRAQGQTMLSMIGMTSGGILNLILDPIFIFTFKLGIKGAAIATMAGQILSMVIMAVFFISGKSIIKVGPKLIARKPAVYFKILKMGVPTICRQGLGSLSTAILNNQAALYGDAAVAAISIANKLYMLVRGIILGIGQGYQPIAGYCFGAGRKQRLKKLLRTAVVAGTILGLALAAAIFIFREPIMVWFRDDAEVVSIGGEMLAFMCISMPLLAFSTFVNQTYQCLGFAGGATFLASCRQGIFFIPLAFILPHLFQLVGIEMIQAGADVLTFIISIPFIIHFVNKNLSGQENANEL